MTRSIIPLPSLTTSTLARRCGCMKVFMALIKPCFVEQSPPAPVYQNLAVPFTLTSQILDLLLYFAND